MRSPDHVFTTRFGAAEAPIRLERLRFITDRPWKSPVLSGRFDRELSKILPTERYVSRHSSTRRYNGAARR
jgi:hypothetical protein